MITLSFTMMMSSPQSFLFDFLYSLLLLRVVRYRLILSHHQEQLQQDRQVDTDVPTLRPFLRQRVVDIQW